MKWLFYVIVFVYMFYRTVYGLKPVENDLIVDTVTYGDDEFLKVGGHKTISCKATNKNLKVGWFDPDGKFVKRQPGSRIFSQEHFVASMKGRSPALVLTITNAVVTDTGVYKCKSGNIEKSVSLCVIDPSDFADTPPEVSADLGRSITLSCQAKGNPEPRILWNRNGETITDETSNKYSLMTKYNIEGFEGLLTITSLEPEDSGIYSCISIQENAKAENCSYTQTFNITLDVNFAPVFEDGNETKLVFGEENQQVDITCSAAGFPTPTFRWFKDIGDEILYEFDKKQIKLIDDNTQAVLTILANQSTFGQRFKCEASNEQGVSYKHFVLLKIEIPATPRDVISSNATHESVQLQITWYGDIQFPINVFIVESLKVGGNARKITVPREQAWKRSTQLEITKFQYAEDSGFMIELYGLEEDASYWVRVKVQNNAGESAWSLPIKVSTTTRSEEVSEETTTVENPEAEPETADDEGNMSDGAFYGIFFAGGIFVVSFVCMFAMRMVK